MADQVVDVTENVALAGPASTYSASVPAAMGPPGGMGITTQGFGQEGYLLPTDELGPSEKPSEMEFNYSVGVPYFLPFSTPYRDSWEVFRDDPVTIQQLVSMRRRDGQARALFRLIVMPILAALKNCNVIPPDGQEGGSNEAQFIEDMFFLPPEAGGMTHTFSRFIKQMLLSVFDGFSAFEEVYWVPETGPLKGKITLRKLDYRPSETLTFLLDGQGEFNGFRQRTFFQGRTIDVKIPRDRAVYFAVEEAERPFYGVSMFESAFFHYDKKEKLYHITHLAAQRAAVGTRIGTMPPGATPKDKTAFLAALRDLGLAQYIAVPSSAWTVTNLKEEGSFDFLGLINHHNNQMSKSVLAPWFDDMQGGGGDTTLVDFGKQSDATFMMMEQGIMEDMAAVINHRIIPKFIDWNFGSGKYPTFEWGALTEEQQAAIQDTFDKLAAAGQQSNVSSEFMLELEKRMAEDIGLEIDYAPIEKRAKEQQKLKDQMAKQMAMGGGPGGPGGVPGQVPPGAGDGQQGAGYGASPGGGGAPGSSGGGGGQDQNAGFSSVPQSLLPDGFSLVRASVSEVIDSLFLADEAE